MAELTMLGIIWCVLSVPVGLAVGALLRDRVAVVEVRHVVEPARVPLAG